MNLNNVVYLKKTPKPKHTPKKKKTLEFSAFSDMERILIIKQLDTKEKIILLPILKVHCQVAQ